MLTSTQAHCQHRSLRQRQQWGKCQKRWWVACELCINLHLEQLDCRRCLVGHIRDSTALSCQRACTWLHVTGDEPASTAVQTCGLAVLFDRSPVDGLTANTTATATRPSHAHADPAHSPHATLPCLPLSLPFTEHASLPHHNHRHICHAWRRPGTKFFKQVAVSAHRQQMARCVMCGNASRCRAWKRSERAHGARLRCPTMQHAHRQS